MNSQQKLPRAFLAGLSFCTHCVLPRLGALVGVADGKQQTSLFVARAGCVELLLSHGADPAALDAEGESALTSAIESRNFSRVRKPTK